MAVCVRAPTGVCLLTHCVPPIRMQLTENGLVQLCISTIRRTITTYQSHTLTGLPGFLILSICVCVFICLTFHIPQKKKVNRQADISHFIYCILYCTCRKQQYLGGMFHFLILSICERNRLHLDLSLSLSLLLPP